MDPVERLAREVGRELGEGPGPERRRSQRRAAARLGAGPHGHVPWTRSVVSLGLVAGALLLIWFTRQPTASPPLTARIGDLPFAAGAWLAAEDQPRTLEVSDRSRVRFAPGSAARLVRLGAEEVALDLEYGRLDASVVPSPGRAWRVAAGPFSVDVTGTIFTLEWRPEPRTLVVAVREGEVRVRGGTLPPEGSAVASQQRLEVSDASLAAADPIPSSAPTPAPTDAAPEPAAPRSPHPEPEWRRLAAAGEHAAALARVERDGLTQQLERFDAEELDRLAHSARLADAGATANAALEALRRRFPRDPRAHNAAFLLGRVALEMLGAPAQAAEWFEVYVQEQPRGALVEDARGRLLELRRDHGDPRQIEAAARAYLEHHPGGSRAGLARGLLDPP